MEETYKRENDKMVKLVQHDEKMLSNQEVYNFWCKICAKEAQFNQQLRQIQTQLDMVRESKERLREIAKDCERRIPKGGDVNNDINIIPSEVKENE